MRNLLLVWVSAELLWAQPLAVNTGVPLRLEPGGILWCEGTWINGVGGTFQNSGTVYVLGDVRNDDPGQLFIAGATPGTLVLQGSLQVLQGTQPIRTDTLRLVGSGPKVLDTDLYVDGQLQLGDAELRTQTHKAIVRNPDPLALTRQNGFVSSDLGGYLERWTDRTAVYLFPVGGHTPLRYRPVLLTPSVGAPHRWAVRLANVDPTSEGLPRSQRSPDLCEINPLYYHYVDRLAGTDAATITLTYDPADPVKGPIAQWKALWEPTPASAGPTAWSLLSWSDFSTPNFAFSAPALTSQITASADTLAPGEPVQLTAQVAPPQPGLIYTWLLGDGQTATGTPLTYSYTSPGQYWVTLIVTSSEGCRDTASYRLIVRGTTLYIPNAFSPNGDGLNEMWEVPAQGFRQVRWRIYDRWGLLVAKGQGSSIRWDGTKNGQPCAEGVYVYLIELERADGGIEKRAGTLTLLR